jgi:hypothetical protein
MLPHTFPILLSSLSCPRHFFLAHRRQLLINLVVICWIFKILTFFKKIYFKNSTLEILFAHLTLLAAPTHMARQNNVVAPHAACNTPGVY